MALPTTLRESGSRAGIKLGYYQFGYLYGDPTWGAYFVQPNPAQPPNMASYRTTRGPLQENILRTQFHAAYPNAHFPYTMPIPGASWGNYWQSDPVITAQSWDAPQFDWRWQQDQYDWCVANGLEMWPPFIFFGYNAAWIRDGGLTTAQRAALARSIVFEYVRFWHDKTHAIEVWAEALWGAYQNQPDSIYWRDIGVPNGYPNTTEGMVEQSLRWADEARTYYGATGLQLRLRDYPTASGTLSESYDLCASLKSRGVPLDGFTWEGYPLLGTLNTTQGQAAWRSQIEAFQALGLTFSIGEASMWHLTEVDGEYGTPLPGTAPQGWIDLLDTILPAGVTEIGLGAISDADAFGGPYSTLWDSSYQPRAWHADVVARINALPPAVTVTGRVLSGAWWTGAAIQVTGPGVVGPLTHPAPDTWQVVVDPGASPGTYTISDGAVPTTALVYPPDAESDGAGAAVASLHVSHPVSANATGESAGAATMRIVPPLVGTVDTGGSASATLRQVHRIPGQAAGQGAGTGTLGVTDPSVGPIGRIFIARAADGSSFTFASRIIQATAGDGTGQGVNIWPTSYYGTPGALYAAAGGQGGGQGALRQTVGLAGEAAGAGAGGGVQGQVAQLSGVAQGMADAAATTTQVAGMSLRGAAGGVGAAAAVLAQLRPLIGRADGQGGATAVEGQVVELAGQADGAGGGVVSVLLGHPLAGRADGSGAAGADLTRTVYRPGRADGAGAGAATLSQSRPLAGEATGAGAAAGSTGPKNPLQGGADGAGGGEATLGATPTELFVGAADGQAAGEGTLSRDYRLRGSADGHGGGATFEPGRDVILTGEAAGQGGASVRARALSGVAITDGRRRRRVAGRGGATITDGRTRHRVTAGHQYVERRTA